MIGNGQGGSRIVGSHGESNFIGIFGEQNSESWQTDVSVNFVYQISTTDDVKDLSSGTGSITKQKSLAKISSGASGIGHLQTIDRVRYRNGHTLGARYTMGLSSQPTAARVIVINDSVPITINELDLNDFDFTKINIIQHALGYLGNAPIITDIMEKSKSSMRSISSYRPQGETVDTHISNPYLAVSCIVENTKIQIGLFEPDSGVALEFDFASGDHHVLMGSIFAGVLADNLSPSNRPVHHKTRETGLAAATFAIGKYRNIATYRSVGTFQGVVNKILSALNSLNFMGFDVGVSGDAEIVLVRNAIPDVVFTNFVPVDPVRSVIEVDTADVLLTVDDKNIGWSTGAYLVAGQGNNPDVYSPGSEDALKLNLVLEPGVGTYSLAVKFDSTFSFRQSMIWKELF